jgi:hypothetical protein
MYFVFKSIGQMTYCCTETKVLLRYSTNMIKFFAPLFLENKVSTSTYAQQLSTNGQRIETRFRTVGESAAMRKLLCHIVAIERWGLNRLRVLNGEKPFIMDSSKIYSPLEDSPWSVLLTDFNETRRELVALAPLLEGNTGKVAHNMMGDLSAKAWLKYLDFHANAESTKARSQQS